MTIRSILPYLVITVLITAGCVDAHAITVEFDPSTEVEFSEAERSMIIEIAQDTEAEVRQLLPQLPRKITVTVSSGRNVIPESGMSSAELVHFSTEDVLSLAGVQ